MPVENTCCNLPAKAIRYYNAIIVVSFVIIRNCLNVLIDVIELFIWVWRGVIYTHPRIPPRNACCRCWPNEDATCSELQSSSSDTENACRWLAIVYVLICIRNPWSNICCWRAMIGPNVTFWAVKFFYAIRRKNVPSGVSSINRQCYLDKNSTDSALFFSALEKLARYHARCALHNFSR